MGKLFGTDGIRGIAGEELTAELAFRLGLAVSKVLTGQENKKTRVIIGKDTRLSGDMFEAAITAGLCAMGSDVYLVGRRSDAGGCFSRKRDRGRCRHYDISFT